MWIRRAIFDALRDELLAERTRATVLSEQSARHLTQTAFLMGQINQLQKERAIMVRHITKLEIPIPELAGIPTPVISEKDIIAAMGSAMFDDMGDDDARRQGVTWDDGGNVEYKTPKKGNGHA